MKRSRRSEYDKKKDRSKKDSKRKFTFDNKSSKATSNSDSSQNSSSKSASNSNTIDRLQRFEIDENQQQKYTQRHVRPKKKFSFSGFQLPLIVVILLLVAKFALRIVRMESSSSTETNQDKISERVREKLRSTYKPTKVRVANFIVGKDKRLREVIQLQKDSTFPIVENVNVRLFKGFHIYDSSAFPTTPILAKFSKYYFFYDEVPTQPKVSMTNHWLSLRNDFTRKMYGSKFSFHDIKNYTFKGMQIEEKKFTIASGTRELHGVATLITSGDKRYFFHFISKEKEGKYFNTAYLKKYLNYYLKIR